MSAVNTQKILRETEKESEAMRIIAEKTQVDSRSTKILTCVTIFYVPANLIAVRLQLPT